MKLFITYLLLSFLFIESYSQHKVDSVAIRLLLEKESATWRSGDIKGHESCWVIKPYSRILVSTGDSVVLDIPPATMINPPLNMIGGGGYAINTNYQMHISGANAWVSHNEESVSKEGKRTYSYEIRILEKIKGNWKLVAQSIHIYKRGS